MATENSEVVAGEAGTTGLRTCRSDATVLRAYTMLFALAVIWIYFQWMTRSELYPLRPFLHPLNRATLLKQMSVTGVLSVGMLLLIVARQIDLSVGSLVG